MIVSSNLYPYRAGESFGKIVGLGGLGSGYGIVKYPDPIKNYLMRLDEN